jgi:hypothetical protein
MLRLVKSVEKRPEEAIVINWTVPVYIKNGEDYYKVCFDIKRKPLSDGALELTESELEEFKQFIKDDIDSNINFVFQEVVRILGKDVVAVFRSKITSRYQLLVISDYKAILWLAERFDLTSNN